MRPNDNTVTAMIVERREPINSLGVQPRFIAVDRIFPDRAGQPEDGECERLLIGAAEFVTELAQLFIAAGRSVYRAAFYLAAPRLRRGLPPRPNAGGWILNGGWPSLPDAIRRAMLALIG